MVTAGGLVSYGPDLLDQFGRADSHHAAPLGSHAHSLPAPSWLTATLQSRITKFHELASIKRIAVSQQCTLD
jgi:hypothetical protein